MTETSKGSNDEVGGKTDRLSDITVLLDRTGSMNSVKQQTIGGFNEFLAGQRYAAGRATLTLVQFDSIDPHDVCGEAGTPVEDVPDLTEETYQPRAQTPLWDALGMSILSTDTRLKTLADSDFPDDVLFVVVTDGYENASREFQRDQVIQMVGRREAECGWKFIYLGADIDTFGRGNFGSKRERSAGIAKSKMMSAMRATSGKMAAYRGSGKEEDLDWTDEERKDLS